MKYKTKKEATQSWLKEWNAFPEWMIRKMIGEDYETFRNITPQILEVGDDVMCTYDDEYLTSYGERYEIKEILDNDEIVLEVGDVLVKVDRSNIETDEAFNDMPMWSTLWEMSDSADYYWLESEENRIKIAECGIEIYEYDDGENQMYLLGINGAGYDFYESHWIPFYEKRGLQWHSED